MLTANPHILTSHTMQSLADEFKKTPAQLFFRYLTQSGVVPLTSTCTVQHMKEDLDVLNFKFSDDIMNVIIILLN